MTQRSMDTARRAGLIAVAVALGAALSGSRARLRERASDGSLERLRERASNGSLARLVGNRPGTSPDRSAERTYTCECGTTYRVAGIDRHRVMWPASAPEDAPVMGDHCVKCDAPLPSGRVSDERSGASGS